MKWALNILILCSLAALSWTCCSPPQWEGKQITFGGYASLFHHGLLKEFNYVAYDAEGKRSTVFMTYINGHVHEKLQIVTRFDDDGEGGMMYVDNLGRHKCWKKHIKGKFREACVPKKAKDLGQFSLGLKGGYKAHSFELGGEELRVIISVQPVEENVCAPMSELITGRLGHYDILNVVSFTDITPGIKNATIFDVPRDCEEIKYDEEMEMVLELRRSVYVLAV